VWARGEGLAVGCPHAAAIFSSVGEGKFLCAEQGQVHEMKHSSKPSWDWWEGSASQNKTKRRPQQLEKFLPLYLLHPSSNLLLEPLTLVWQTVWSGGGRGGLAELQLLRAGVHLGGPLRTAGMGAEVPMGRLCVGQVLPKRNPCGSSSHRALKVAEAIAIWESITHLTDDE